MTAVTFPLRPPRLAFAICGWRWQNDVHEIKYSVCVKKNCCLCKCFTTELYISFIDCSSQEPLWLLDVIEDVCYQFNVRCFTLK